MISPSYFCRSHRKARIGTKVEKRHSEYDLTVNNSQVERGSCELVLDVDSQNKQRDSMEGVGRISRYEGGSGRGHLEATASRRIHT